MTDCYFSLKDWQATGGPSLLPSAFEGRGAIAGLDWRSSGGPISLAVVAAREDGGIDLWTRFWMLLDAFQALPPDHPCRGFFQMGPRALTVMQPVDDALEDVADTITSLLRLADVRELLFDPAHAADLISRLMKRGISCVEFATTARNLSDPLMLLDGYVRERRVRHSDNPVMNWMISNTVRRKSRRVDLDYPDRRSGEEWIDGVSAALFAFGRLAWHMENDRAAASAPEPPAHPPGDYAIVEILGHQTLIGRVEEVERFGSRMLRIEPIFCGVLLGPIYQSGGSLYRFSSCAADVAFARAPRRLYQLPEAVRAAQDPGVLETLEEADLARRRAAETPLIPDRRAFLGESDACRDVVDADFEDDEEEEADF